ncbi:hypothetical protein ND899_07905 [Vibrio diabolicus]|nr:hypothetical protein [Vibrio diabolicus]
MQTTNLIGFYVLKSGVVPKRFSLKPLGTNNAVENRLTTPKSSFGKTISQCGLSASKSVFETTNSPSNFSKTNFHSFNLKAARQEEIKSKTIATLDINQGLNTRFEGKYNSFNFEFSPLDSAT